MLNENLMVGMKVHMHHTCRMTGDLIAPCDLTVVIESKRKSDSDVFVAEHTMNYVIGECCDLLELPTKLYK